MDTARRSKSPILVLGVGNVLQSDDGVGVHVVERLQAATLPEEVELIDGGTAGLDLLSTVEGREEVIVIDAVDGGMEPGTMYRFTPDELDKTTVRLDSLHQFGLLETLQMAALIGREPKQTVIIGVQPAVVDWGLDLTDTIAARLPDVIEQVMREIDRAVAAYRNNVNNSKQVG